MFVIIMENVEENLCGDKSGVGLLGNEKIELQRKKVVYWTRTLMFAIFGSTLGTSFPLGYILASTNSPTEYVIDWCNKTLISSYDAHLSEEDLLWLWSSVISAFLVGGIIGSLFSAPIANKYGRRLSFSICGLCLLISGVCFIFCRMAGSVKMLFIGRLFSGLAFGITISILPMYHTELALVEHRGSVGVFFTVGLSCGAVFGQIFTLQNLLGTEELWHIALSLFLVPVIISHIPFKLYPESPKWLYVIDGNRKAAEAQLKRLRVDKSPTAISAELDFMKQEVDQQANQGSSSYCQVLRDKKLLLPTVIVCSFQAGQQLSGISATLFYSVSVFRKVGLTQQEASFANLGVGMLNMTIALLGPYRMRRFNRRPLMMTSTLGCSICLLVFCFLVKYIDFANWFSSASIACMCFYIIFYHLGIGPIPVLIGAELFEVAPRSVAMSLGGFSATISNFIISMTFPTLQNLCGGFVFTFFSLACFLLFLFTKYYLPETRGHDPTEISPLVANGFKSKIHANR